MTDMGRTDDEGLDAREIAAVYGCSTDDAVTLVEIAETDDAIRVALGHAVRGRKIRRRAMMAAVIVAAASAAYAVAVACQAAVPVDRRRPPTAISDDPPTFDELDAAADGTAHPTMARRIVRTVNPTGLRGANTRAYYTRAHRVLRAAMLPESVGWIAASMEHADERVRSHGYATLRNLDPTNPALIAYRERDMNR